MKIASHNKIIPILLFACFFAQPKLAQAVLLTSQANVCVGKCPLAELCLPISGTITQLPYGGFSHSSSDAIDIGASLGTPIYAPITGNYSYQKGTSAGANIKTSFSSEGQTYTLTFMHLQLEDLFKNRLNKTTSLKKGDIIGYCNSTGFSTGNHLHLEISPGSSKYQTSLIGKFFFNNKIPGVNSHIEQQCSVSQD